jgi:undecaprenyl-diphosphatase
MAWIPAVQALDERVLMAARGAPAALVPLFHALTVLGGGWAMLGFAPFLVRAATRRATGWLLAAIVVQSGIVAGIKLLVGRVRPCDALAWCAPIDVRSPGGGSFPSGHAAGAFAFAAFVAIHAPRWAVPAWIAAGLVAWSRCVLGVHYPSDVLVGAAVGAVIGTLFARRAKARVEPPARVAETDRSASDAQYAPRR